MNTHESGPEPYYVEDPPAVRKLLVETRFAWIWLIPRLYLGVYWLMAGAGVLLGPTRAAGNPDIVGGLLPAFAPEMGDLQPLTLALADLAVGLLLIAGAFTGPTAFISILLSFNTLAAGPAAIDPFALAATMLVVLAWRVSGWYGLDRWLLLSLEPPFRVTIRRVPAEPKGLARPVDGSSSQT